MKCINQNENYSHNKFNKSDYIIWYKEFQQNGDIEKD